MLAVGTLVGGGQYVVKSLPYRTETQINKDKEEYWQGIVCTIYHYEEDDEWYIVQPFNKKECN